MRRTDRPLEHATLVLGATGGFGGAVTLELLDRDYSVKVLVRDRFRLVDHLGYHERIQVIEGDVQDIETLSNAARGCGTIVHGINVPFHKWDPQMISATSNVIAAAKANQAQILFPGNVYGLGEQPAEPIPETTPNQPTTKKGRLRVELENALGRSTREGVPRVIILRGSDLFGPTVRNSLVDKIFGNASQGKPIEMIGDPDAPHQWVYAPDIARAGIDLLEIAGKLHSFEIVHFSGFTVKSQREFLRYVAEQAGHPNLKIEFNPTSWKYRGVLGIVAPELRELAEMEYLFNDCVILDDRRRRDLLPAFQSTPLRMAVHWSVDSYLERAA